MPKISVVIPVFNGQKTIQETLVSVLQQTFVDLEVIVINDGSQDATQEILEKIDDPRLRVFPYSNAGLAESRNRGIAHARGECIAFLDADDLWTTDKLDAQWKALQACPEAAVAYSWTDYIDESGQFVKSGKHRVENGDVLEKLLVDNLLENGSNPLVRKDALEQVGGFDSSINTAADWDMWLRLAQHFHFVTVPIVQVFYRISDSSMSSNIRNQEAQCLEVIKRFFSKAPVSFQPLKRKSLVNLYRYLAYKAVEDSPSREKGIVAAHCFLNYIRYHPALLSQGRIILGMSWRIAVMLFLPPKSAKALLKGIRLFKPGIPKHENYSACTSSSNSGKWNK